MLGYSARSDFPLRLFATFGRVFDFALLSERLFVGLCCTPDTFFLPLAKLFQASNPMNQYPKYRAAK